ncbi:DEAD/DEAH box helicase [candidate division KSB1 bacterium]|nr:DEAD/DEAH box helicase [candidate division KSB1 bacterium]
MKTFIKELKISQDFADQIVHHEVIQARKGVYQKTKRPLSSPVARALKKMGITELYSHQAKAIDFVRGGSNVVVVTPTASGKTLTYNIPVLESILRDKNTKALYIFPLKALEQDQLKGLDGFGALLGGERGGQAAIYDGDTSAYRRKKIKADFPNIILTNPDMIHQSILPFHPQWEPFFRGLKFVIIDELHTYRGIFGSHILQVLRRFSRVCKFYGAQPQFITCSGTINNPRELAETLVGAPFELVADNGAPQAEKHFLFLNPVLSPYTEAAKIFRRCLKRGFKTIAFTRSRKVTELIHAWTLDAEPELAPLVSSYRAGFLPEERREIEEKLFSGELLGVISTSALEMGIDIGGLDVCLLVGYPGTVINTWQRGGRVGRGDNPSLIVLIALPNALDQYFMRHPGDFFGRSFEKAVVDGENPEVIKDHLVAAAAEVPLSQEETSFDLIRHQGVLRGLVKEGWLLESAAGNQYFSARLRPQREVDIRSIGESFTIYEGENKRLVGQVNGGTVFGECHPGAVYLHRARQYLVRNLDLEKREVLVEPVEVSYYTQPLSEKETEILSVERSRPVENFLLRQGRLRVTEQVVGFQKRRIFSQELLSVHDLDLPAQTYETVGIWLEIEGLIQEYTQKKNYHFIGSLHGVEHAVLALFPLFALCDRWDLGGICYPIHPQVQKAAIFFYDGYPGGVGLTPRGYEVIESLLERTLSLIEGCPCEEGCPSCIHSPKCGSGNKPLDKQGAREVLRILLGKISFGEVKEMIEGLSPVSHRKEVAFREKRVSPSDRKRVLFFDLETQRSADEVGGWGNIHLMRLAVGVLYDSLEEKYFNFYEKDVDNLIEYLKKADLVVGFNIKRFDYRVLMGYSDEDFDQIPTFDILQDVQRRLGHRLKLDSLARSTLKVAKTADGLQSIEWFKQGEIDKVRDYCQRDVEITRDLFQFGVRNGYLLYEKKNMGTVRLPVDWDLEEIVG